MSKKLKQKKDKRIKTSLFSFWRFALYFMMVGFVVTCSFFLFFRGWGYVGTDILITQETLKSRAISTLLNILFLCAFFAIFDSVKKRITVERPVTRILEATHKITKGDFSVRIKPLHKKSQRNEFDVIIEDFNKMTQELSSIETLKTDFIANVSHEIKTPLSVIQNYAALLQDPKLSDEERQMYCKNLTEASSKLSELITSILKLSKLENQQIFPVTTKYLLSEQLCECIIMFEEEWERKNLEIITELDETLEIEADSELLFLIWTNLLSNAVKFTDQGGSITVKLFKENGFTVVSVSDTGCGMTEETGKHIFEKFYQGDSSRSTRGNGLGLALVKRVIDIIEGEISVESELGKGTTFTMKLSD